MRQELIDKLLADAEDCKKDFTANDYTPTLNDIPFYYIEGAKWTLNNLWHPISNQPDDNKPLLLEKVHEYGSVSYTIAQFKDGRIKWGGCHECRLKLFNRWCYIEDLLPVETLGSAAVDNENEKDGSEKTLITDTFSKAKIILKNVENGMKVVVTNLILNIQYKGIADVVSTGSFFAEDIADFSRTLNYSCADWINRRQMIERNRKIEVYTQYPNEPEEHVADLFNVWIDEVDFESNKFNIGFDHQIFYQGTEFGDKYILKCESAEKSNQNNYNSRIR
jgi:hypothetical protein